jgi:GT2 family glycosyltransferase
MHPRAEVGAVIIGRNEGERLVRCLDSVLSQVAAAVYVDSGSTDDSVAMATARGVEVVSLDLSRPFTAARARNEGCARLLEVSVDIRFVQFIDGDCELREGWVEAAFAALEARPDVVVVCGRRRERFPEASVFNALCDVEWGGEAGEVDSSGGDALMRCDAFQAVDGFRAHLIAGEEPDLCYRMRRAGGTILRIDHEMTWHDAAMMKVGQWWNRTRRAGHAYAENYWDHRRDRAGFRKADVRRILFWGGAVPITILGLGIWQPWALLGLLVFPLQAWRIRRKLNPMPAQPGLAMRYAWSCVLGKFPEVLGVVQYFGNRVAGRRGKLIEYK